MIHQNIRRKEKGWRRNELYDWGNKTEADEGDSTRLKVGPEQDKVMRGALSDGFIGAQDDPDQDLTMTKCTNLDRHPPFTNDLDRAD